MSFIWHTFFFDPIYNSLIFFIDVVRGGDVGIAIILTVILVKVVLLPLSLKAIRTQIVMRDIEPMSIMAGIPVIPIKKWHRINTILNKMVSKNN